MKKIIILLTLKFGLIISLIGQIPGQGSSAYIGVISAYRVPLTNPFWSTPTFQSVYFNITSLNPTGYFGLRRLRGKAYLGNNTSNFENNATHKFMQLRIIDSAIPNKNTLRVGWRFTTRIGSISPQYEIGMYSHINHYEFGEHGREAYTFQMPGYSKFKIFEYSLIIGRAYGFATRIQYQGMDSTVWIVRTIQDWKVNGFALNEAEASLYAKLETAQLTPLPHPVYINAYSNSIITPSFSHPTFWHVNVGMMDTWVKAGEYKEVTAKNYINLILKSLVSNKKNPTHPPNPNVSGEYIVSPYLKVESGGMLKVEAKQKIETKIDNNNISHRFIDISNGAVTTFIIVP